MPRPIPGTALRFRRSARRDLDGVRTLLGVAADRRRKHFDRRVLGDPAYDVYVAEDAEGGIVGLVAMAYVRSLGRGRLAAVLDGVWAREHDALVVDALVAHGEMRAWRRGCDRVVTTGDTAQGVVRGVLAARGYRGHECLVRHGVTGSV